MTDSTGESGTRSSPPDEAQLTARFWERVRLFAARRLRDQSAAEDVAQETLRRVLEALRNGRVENLDALPGFVFQTAQHLCLQQYRSSGREERALERLGRAGRPSGEADPLRGLIAEERRHAVLTALDRLAPDERELLRLLYYEQVDPARVAERLGVTPGNLRVRKHRLLRKLGQLLDQGQL
jgi:RNA polymerase sigma-70 factor, ECF subfamily